MPVLSVMGSVLGFYQYMTMCMYSNNCSPFPNKYIETGIGLAGKYISEEKGKEQFSGWSCTDVSDADSEHDVASSQICLGCRRLGITLKANE